MRSSVLLALTMLSSGCTHIYWPDVSVRRMQTAADGRDRYVVHCPPGSMCGAEEHRLCPIGYDRESTKDYRTEIITCWNEVPPDPCIAAKVCELRAEATR